MRKAFNRAALIVGTYVIATRTVKFAEQLAEEFLKQRAEAKEKERFEFMMGVNASMHAEYPPPPRTHPSSN